MRSAAQIRINAASEGNVEALFCLISELASYEKREITGDAEMLRRSLFEREAAKALLIEVDEEVVGYAIYLQGFSSFSCSAILWLEDLYVRPGCRGRGIGWRVMVYLAREAIEADLDRIEWHVLDWNEPAMNFYEKLGAQKLEGWNVLRLERDGIKRLYEQRA